MKNRILLFVLSFVVFQLNAQVCTTSPTNVYVSQSQINSFNSSTQDFHGDIWITGPGSEVCNNITTLNPLINLRTISGDLIIEQSCYLTSLEGLSNLTSVGGCVRLRGDGCNTINGLRNLRTIGGNFTISNCAMSTLQGLENLISIGGSLEISRHFLLGNLTALDHTITIGGTVSIVDNQNITDCAVAAICNKLTGAYFSRNANNGNCIGVAEVTAACTKCPPTGNFNFTTQAQINTFGASYPNCDIIKGNLTISGANIVNLNGLSGVTTIKGTLTIQNTALPNLTGLGALQTVESDVTITGNPVLTSLSGIGDYNWFNSSANLTITNNSSLSNCSAYAICSELCGSGTNITISGNAAGCMTKSAAKATCATDNYKCSCQWIGGASGDWNVAGNWSCGQIPDATVRPVIYGDATISFSVNTSIYDLITQVGTIVFQINNAIVTLNNETSFQSDFTANLTNASLKNNTASTLRAYGSLNISPVSGTNSIVNCGTIQFGTMANITVPFDNCTAPNVMPILRGCGVLNYSSPYVVTGTLAPGSSPGTLTINPSVSSTPTSIYEMEITGGYGNAGIADDADKLESEGNIELDGTLKLILTSPEAGSYTIFNSTGGSVSGFNNLTVLYSTDGGATFSPTTPPNTTIQTNSNNIIVNINGSVLPVELLDFKGKNTEGGNLLTWQTANEVNNKGFQIERGSDGKAFDNIGFVKAKGSHSTYNFTDNTPLSTSYYRLRQIDNNGKETLSKVISVANKGNSKLKVSPNPVSNMLIIETDVDLVRNETNTFHIFNLLGQQVLMGKMAQRIDVSALPQGTYFLKVGGEQVKFIKQ